LEPFFKRTELTPRDVYGFKLATSFLIATRVTWPLIPLIGPEATIVATRLTNIATEKLIDHLFPVTPPAPQKQS
jgi:hypothetical protein